MFAFSESYDEQDDKRLIEEALSGSRAALERLIKRHYNFMYNVALRFVLNPQDAQDLTQEAIVKVITKLSQYRSQAKFRSWLYRIVFNHFMNSKSRPLEEAITSFDAFADDLDRKPLKELSDKEAMELREAVEDARLGCMTGMLLCLNRSQRLIYIIGEIFSIDSQIAASVLEMSPTNFRKILSRARHDLYQFMNNKCGLVNTSNPCRCPKKTKSFIECGYVHPDNLQFNSDFIDKIETIASKRLNTCDDVIEERYALLYRDHPYYDRDQSHVLIGHLLLDEDFRKTFNLN